MTAAPDHSPYRQFLTAPSTVSTDEDQADHRGGWLRDSWASARTGPDSAGRPVEPHEHSRPPLASLPLGAIEATLL
jgi:hypothetical protein